MATLKEHQAAMVDLLANGSGIPASASRLAHAMHDVLEAMTNQVHEESMQQSKDFIRKYLNDRADATTPGLNDKALSKREKALKTDSLAKWPTPAEQRVKELTNTVGQLKANLVQVRGERDDMTVSYNAVMTELRQLRCDHDFKYRSGAEASHCLKCGVEALPEQAGCRKPDTQVCEHLWIQTDLCDVFECLRCGVQEIKK